MFPPGFRYRMGSLIYTVKEDVTQDPSSPMREVLLSDGSTQIIPVETLLKDMKEIENCNSKTGGEIMEPDKRLDPQFWIEQAKKIEAAQKKAAKKKVKKKTAKKKVAKKKKKKTTKKRP